MSNTELVRANILTEALPYIQRYNGKTVVIHWGDEAPSGQEVGEAMASDLTMLRLVGIQVVLVLSAGCPFQTRLVAALNRAGSRAVGLTGVDGGSIVAQDGSIVRVNGSLLSDCLAQGYTPVVSAQALCEDGSVCPVDGDSAAGKLAVALKAEKLIHLLAKEQLLKDSADAQGPVPVLNLSRVPALIRSGVIPADMAGKVNASVEAVRSGVTSATLLDGGVPHAILLELLSDAGIGTMLTH